MSWSDDPGAAVWSSVGSLSAAAPIAFDLGTLDTPARKRCGEATDQARDDANDIPQQRIVGRMMNVGLHHRGVDTQLLAVFQSELDRRLHHQIIDRLERLGREPIEAAVERIVSRHWQTIEVRELAQCASVGNPLA